MEFSGFHFSLMQPNNDNENAYKEYDA